MYVGNAKSWFIKTQHTLYFLYRTNWKYFADDSFFHTYVFEKIADFHREKKKSVCWDFINHDITLSISKRGLRPNTFEIKTRPTS